MSWFLENTKNFINHRSFMLIIQLYSLNRFLPKLRNQNKVYKKKVISREDYHKLMVWPDNDTGTAILASLLMLLRKKACNWSVHC